MTIDAIGCQKAIVKQIVDSGGDYLLTVKATKNNCWRISKRRWARP